MDVKVCDSVSVSDVGNHVLRGENGAIAVRAKNGVARSDSDCIDFVVEAHLFNIREE